MRQRARTDTLKIFGDGVWTWFSDPRAVRYASTHDKTYVGYVNSAGNVIVSSYNNNNGTTVNFTLKAALQVDDHTNPVILIRPDGKIQCFYAKHSSGDSIFYRISTNVEDVSAFEAEATVSTVSVGVNGVSYVNPFYLISESKYYCFWRAGDRSTHYATSTDGITWTAGIEMLSNISQRPYVKYVSNGTDKIHFSYTNGHPNEVTNSIYHVYYQNGNFYKTNGTLIEAIASLPLSITDGTLVYDGTSTNSWVWDIALDSNGYPVIVFATFPSTTDHRYWYAKWNGAAWVVTQITPAGTNLYASEAYYSAGISLDHDDPAIVYLAKKKGNLYRIYKYTTANNGVTWGKELITESGGISSIRPTAVWNHGAHMSVVFIQGTYLSFTSFVPQVIGLKRIY